MDEIKTEKRNFWNKMKETYLTRFLCQLKYLFHRELIIVIPYRDRAEHLEYFTKYIHNFLEKINHKIIVVEQYGDEPFNRGKLLNVGFELSKDKKTYFCFHDVDLIPQEYVDYYQFPIWPTHIAMFCPQTKDEFHPEYFGGVVLISQEDFESVNGFSNNYWGWGREDVDFYRRIIKENLCVKRLPGKYISLPHKHNKEVKTYKKNQEYFISDHDHKRDGLSDLKYSIIERKECGGYIKYTVKI